MVKLLTFTTGKGTYFRVVVVFFWRTRAHTHTRVYGYRAFINVSRDNITVFAPK